MKKITKKLFIQIIASKQFKLMNLQVKLQFENDNLKNIYQKKKDNLTKWY